jgi:hypothetical protein
MMRRYAFLFAYTDGLYLNDIVVCCELMLWEMTQQGLAVDMSFCGSSSPATAGLQTNNAREAAHNAAIAKFRVGQQHCRNIQLKHKIKNQK